MPRRYVSQLGHQESVNQVFMVAEKQLRPNRNGNLYLQMELSDRSGTIGARMWNASGGHTARSRTATTCGSKAPRSSSRGPCN